MTTLTFTENFLLEAGKDIKFNLTPEQLNKLASHDEVAKLCFLQGLTKVVTNSHASLVKTDFKTDEEWQSASQKRAELKIGALMSGDVRIQQGERKVRVPDFVAMTRKVLINMAKKNGKEMSVEDADKFYAENEEALKPIIDQAIADAEAEKARKEAQAATMADLAAKLGIAKNV